MTDGGTPYSTACAQPPPASPRARPGADGPGCLALAGAGGPGAWERAHSPISCTHIKVAGGHPTARQRAHRALQSAARAERVVNG